MKRIFLFFLSAIALDLQGFAQFKEGYIINNNDETIQGYINYEGSINNSDRCEFKLNREGEIKTYKPGEIKAFRFNDSKYFSTWELSVNNELKTIFIEWLIRGRASLLSYSRPVDGTRYFLLLENDSLVELTNTMRSFNKDGKTYERRNQEYKNTLSFYFKDAPSLKPEIEVSAFKGESLIKITKDYHELTCKTGDCIVFEEKNRDMIFTWGISTDFVNSKFILNSDLQHEVFPSKSLGFGLALNIENLPAVSPKFTARFNLTIHSALFRYDTTDTWSLITDDRICKIMVARIPLRVTYKFTHKKLNPFLSLGAVVNLRFSYKQYDQRLVDFITRSRPDNPYTSKVNLFQFAVNAGAGFEYLVNPKFALNAGYEYEIAPQFFGTYIDDHSRNMNHVFYLSALFKLKK
jgi:hypothetical protein